MARGDSHGFSPILLLLLFAGLGCLTIVQNLRLAHKDAVQKSDPETARGMSPEGTSPPPTRGPYILATFADGHEMGEGLHISYSRDGMGWATLLGDPIVFRPHATLGSVFRDPSVVWHGGWFHLAWTTELCAGLSTRSFSCDWSALRAEGAEGAIGPRFGYARSRDLCSLAYGVFVCEECARAHALLEGEATSALRRVEELAEEELAVVVGVGGNARFAAFLADAEIGVSRRVWLALPLETRYHTPAADLWRRRLQAALEDEGVGLTLTPNPDKP